VQYRILILDNELGMGGAETNLRDFIAHSDRSRLALSVCCLKQGGHFKAEIEKLGVPFHDRLLKHRFDAAAFRQLATILREERIQLIDTFTHPNTVAFAWWAKRRGIVERVVVSYHAVGSPDGGRLVPHYLRPLLRECDALVALSQSHRHYLVEKEGLPDRLMQVIPNGVDTRQFAPPSAEERAARRGEFGFTADDVVFVALGSLKPIKRIDLLLRAASFAMKKNSQVRVLLVGDGPDRAMLEALANELGIAPRVTFAGLRSDASTVIKAADALVISSRSEAFPKAVLEAMSTGLPVIATDVGSVREMVEDGASAMVVPGGDETALASAIESMAASSDKRAASGARGREIVMQKFTIEKMCAAREQLFDSLLRKTRAA
jgi:glycosyltransferase involved in cell wall biosynthesis